MKKSIKKCCLILLSFGFISLFTIVLSVFNPRFLYAHKTEVENYTVFHNSELPIKFENRLNSVHTNLQESEFYEEAPNLNICLNDGSLYPVLMEKLRGPAFGWGIHSIATFRGEFNFTENTVELNGYKWNLEQLMTHELTHCLQFTKLGLLDSNPLGNHPNWKWEGYA